MQLIIFLSLSFLCILLTQQTLADNENSVGPMSKGISKFIIITIYIFITLYLNLLFLECQSIDIRNNNDWQFLENCVVIEGYLRVMMISITNEQYLHFPLLLEITEYLLLYKIHGMTTLANLFPNLVLIRGQQLIENYALMIYQMVSLTDIGLISLRLIQRGSVHIEQNPFLCYTTSLDWHYIINKFVHQVIYC